MRSVVMIALGCLLLGGTANAATTKRSSDARAEAHGPRRGVGGERGRLGIQVTHLTEELRQFFGAPRDAGVLLSKVAAAGPAANAGARVGDVLVMIGRARIRNEGDVVAALSRNGSLLPLVVIRHQRKLVLTARLDGETSLPPLAEPPPAHGKVWTKRWQWEYRWPDDGASHSRKPSNKQPRKGRGRI
jgi:hypothetical protein